MRKFLFIFIILILSGFPALAERQPLSDRPIENPSEFYDDDIENPEFEYPKETSTETPPPVEVKSTKDYANIYNNLQPADFSYQHDIDPDQYYDLKDAAWAPYPLLRLNSAIYFKEQTVEPGYYLINPRENKGKWYILFKQNGLVKNIIPVYERDITPEFFYDKHLAKPKLKTSQKIHMGVLGAFGKLKSSKRKEQVKCYMEINDLENYFISIVIYYGNHKYSTIMRTIRL